MWYIASMERTTRFFRERLAGRGRAVLGETSRSARPHQLSGGVVAVCKSKNTCPNPGFREFGQVLTCLGRDARDTGLKTEYPPQRRRFFLRCR